MRFRWFPWTWVVRRAARSFGLIDPALVMARVRKFGQPSQYDMPLEIIRNAVVFHSRGLINTRVIQNNLDWVWPYWIERQFDPRDVSFLPRSANISHINLTHRNWTAVGLPDLALYPLVDPRGLITPLHDGWSLDAWIFPRRGAPLFPSRLREATQQLDARSQSIVTHTQHAHMRLEVRCSMAIDQGEPTLLIDYTARTAQEADLVVSVRPYNCEGVQFIDTLERLTVGAGWRVNQRQEIRFDERPEHVVHSTYAQGDVVHRLKETVDEDVACPVGMASAAACFFLPAQTIRTVRTRLPLGAEAMREHGRSWRASSWSEARAPLARLRAPDARYQELFEASLNTLVHLTAREVYPGPYTYRRFWFRDAALMLEALLQSGGADRARAHLDRFSERQRADGYFESQEGEWDSNGQVLWAFGRYAALTGEPLPDTWRRAALRAVRWLERVREPEGDHPHAGLLPAGFSAEHFGPNDHYYWDVFWAIGGLRAIAGALGARAREAAHCNALAQRFLASAERSIERFALPRGAGAIPASPYRRFDSGAIGVLVSDYPLQLFAPGDARIVMTLVRFIEQCFVNGGFFQDMTHSGVNVYLTLALAQTSLRAGRSDWRRIIQDVQRLASPTGVWPEAIHPLTDGGCIGDGQHGWAAAEWLRWTRNAFVREEGDGLVLCSGLPPEWLQQRTPLQFGPTLTPFGPLEVRCEPVREGAWRIQVQARWRARPAYLIAQPPGFRPQRLEGDETIIEAVESAA